LPDLNILNELIIKQGFGYADLRFSHSDFDSYENAMYKAIEQKKGLWKNVKKNQLPAWLQNERPKLLD
jgi:endonuclease YncB( thermonuclease family)